MPTLTLNGTLTRSGYSINDFPWSVTVTEDSTSTSGNTSTLSFSASITCNTTKTAWDVSNAPTLTITWHDNVANRNTTIASASYSTMPANTTKTINGSLVMAHASNGTASGYVTATWTKNTTASAVPGNGTLGGSSAGALTLTTIPRVPTLSLSASSMTLTTSSGDLTATYTGQASIYYRVTAQINNTSVTVTNADASGSGSKTATIAKSAIITAMPNASQGTLSVTLTAYSNSGRTTSIGNTTKTCSVNIDLSSYKPSISIGTALGVKTSPISGKLVAGKSTASLVATTTKATGAGTTTTTATITASASGLTPKMSTTSSTSTSAVTYSTQTVPSSKTNYTLTVRLVATDSRGATSTAVTSTATVYGYGLPKPNLTAQRCVSGSDSTIDPAGSGLLITWSSSTDYSVGGSNTASSTCVYSIDGGSSQNCNISPYRTALATTSRATVTQTVTDTVGSTATATVTVPVALVPFQLYSNDAGTAVGCGIGAFASSGHFNVGLPLNSSGNIYTNNKAGYDDDTQGVALYNGYVYSAQGVYTGGRTAVGQAHSGAVLHANGNLYMTSNSGASPAIYFYRELSESVTASITNYSTYLSLSINDKSMSFSTGGNLYVPGNVCTNGFNSTTTNETGVIATTNGRVHLCGESGTDPAVYFYHKGTSEVTNLGRLVALEASPQYGNVPRLGTTMAINAGGGLYWNGHRAIVDHDKTNSSGVGGHTIELQWLSGSPNKFRVYVDNSSVGYITLSSS